MKIKTSCYKAVFFLIVASSTLTILSANADNSISVERSVGNLSGGDMFPVNGGNATGTSDIYQSQALHLEFDPVQSLTWLPVIQYSGPKLAPGSRITSISGGSSTSSATAAVSSFIPSFTISNLTFVSTGESDGYCSFTVTFSETDGGCSGGSCTKKMAECENGDNSCDATGSSYGTTFVYNTQTGVDGELWVCGAGRVDYASNPFVTGSDSACALVETNAMSSSCTQG